MKKTISLLSIAIILLTLSGCGKSPKSIVKNGTLPFDQSVTVGDALEGYSYFKETKWESFKTEQGRTIVEFTGVMDLDVYDGRETLDRNYCISIPHGTTKLIKKYNVSISYVCQFHINKDGKSFTVGYLEHSSTLRNPRTGELITPKPEKTELYTLKAIYANKPNPSTARVLYDILYNIISTMEKEQNHK